MGGTLSLQAACSVAMLCSTVTVNDRHGASASYQTIVQGAQFALEARAAATSHELLVKNIATTASLGSCVSDVRGYCALDSSLVANGAVDSFMSFKVEDVTANEYQDVSIQIVAPVPSQPCITIANEQSVTLMASGIAAELGPKSALDSCVLFYGLSSSQYEAEDAPRSLTGAEMPVNSVVFSSANQGQSITFDLTKLVIKQGEEQVSAVGSTVDLHYICYNSVGASPKASLFNVQVETEATARHKFAVRQVQSAVLSSSSGVDDMSSSSSAVQSMSSVSSISSSSGLSSSSSGNVAVLSSSSTASVGLSSSSSSATVSLSSSSSSGIVSTSSSSKTISISSSSSSSFPTADNGLPIGTVQLTFSVSFPFAVNASNFATVQAGLQNDIANNLARGLNITDLDKIKALKENIEVFRIGTYGTSSRRLLQASLDVAFRILGTISNVIQVNNSDMNTIGTTLAAVIADQVFSGTFAATSSGATVPPGQHVVVEEVAREPSSSTGMDATDDGSSSLSGGAIAGIVVGTVVGVALLATVALLAHLGVLGRVCGGKSAAAVATGDDVAAHSAKKAIQVKSADDGQPQDYHNESAA